MENEKYLKFISALNDANKAIKHINNPSISRNLFYNVKHAILQHLDKLGMVSVNGYEYAPSQPLIMLECLGYKFHQPYDSYWGVKYPCADVEKAKAYVAEKYEFETDPKVLFEDSINYIRGFLRYYNLQKEFHGSRPWLQITRFLYPDIGVTGTNVNNCHGLEFRYNGKRTTVKKSDAKRKWKLILNKLHYNEETNA